jgi:2-dehydrotetronate isomerase
MPRFAANLSMLYSEHPFLERFAAAAQDGFQAVEYLFPYSFSAADIAQQLNSHGLTQALFNAPPGGTDKASIEAAWNAGVRGTACIPGKQDEFKEGFDLALQYAQALSCQRLHVMAGLIPTGANQAELEATYIGNLKWACQQAGPQGISIQIEPINTRDMPGFFLNYQAQAHALIERIGEPNLQVQFDLYHAQVMEGDLAMKLRKYLPTGKVGHIQIAGVPERHEPDVGEINYPYLFKLIDSLGYTGFVGCEYRPPKTTSEGLGWMRSLAEKP